MLVHIEELGGNAMNAFDYLNTGKKKGRLHSRPPEEDNEIARFIRESRTANGWDQQSLADRAEVGIKALRAIEQGKLNAQVSTLQKILGVFAYTLGPKPKDTIEEAPT